VSFVAIDLDERRHPMEDKQTAPPPLRDERGRWLKGQSGNKGGTRGPLLTPLLRRAVAALGADDKPVAQALVDAAIREALAGNYQYWKAILERLDGPVLAVALAGYSHINIQWPDDCVAIRELVPDGDEPDE